MRKKDLLFTGDIAKKAVQASQGIDPVRNLLVAKDILRILESKIPTGEAVKQAHDKLRSIGMDAENLREIFLINMWVMACNFSFNQKELLDHKHNEKINTTTFWSMITGQDFSFKVGIMVAGQMRFDWIKPTVQIRLCECNKFHAAVHDVLENGLLKYLYGEVACQLVFSGKLEAKDTKKNRSQVLVGDIVFEGILAKDKEMGLDKFFSRIGLTGQKVVALIEQFYEITYLTEKKKQTG